MKDRPIRVVQVGNSYFVFIVHRFDRDIQTVYQFREDKIARFRSCGATRGTRNIRIWEGTQRYKAARMLEFYLKMIGEMP